MYSQYWNSNFNSFEQNRNHGKQNSDSSSRKPFPTGHGLTGSNLRLIYIVLASFLFFTNHFLLIFKKRFEYCLPNSLPWKWSFLCFYKLLNDNWIFSDTNSSGFDLGPLWNIFIKSCFIFFKANSFGITSGNKGSRLMCLRDCRLSREYWCVFILWF